MAREVVRDEPGRELAILVATPEVCMTESNYAAGSPGTDPHVHHRHADVFHVLEGVLTVRLGRELERVEAGAGMTVIVPPGVVHCFGMEHEGGARFLNVHAPNIGFDEYLRSPTASAQDTDDPPPGGGPPASAAVVIAAALLPAWREWAAGSGADPDGTVAAALAAAHP